jgi:stress response protein YsnF
MSGERNPEVLPLIEEVARVDKEDAVTGRVRVRTVTEETEELVREDLVQDRVEVTRVPIGREIDTVPAVRQEGNVTILSVVEEILVIEKRLMLKEEVHLKRISKVDTVEQSVVLRKQEAVIERTDVNINSQTTKEPLR